MEETNQPRTDETPFSGRLEDSGLSPDGVLKTIEGRPDLLVRTGSERERAVYEVEPYSPAILEKYKTGCFLFNELEENYGIRNPGVHLVVGKDSDHRKKVMIVGSRVEGVTLAEAVQNPSSPETTSEIAEAIHSLSGYLLDKAEHGGEFLWDFNIDHFIYGKISHDEKDSIYVTDVDPRFDTYTGPKGKYSDMGKAFYELATMLGEIESLNGEIDLGAAKANVRAFVDSIPEDGPLYSFVQHMKKEFSWIETPIDVPGKFE